LAIAGKRSGVPYITAMNAGVAWLYAGALRNAGTE
jgi:hypothetical protein